MTSTTVVRTAAATAVVLALLGAGLLLHDTNRDIRQVRFVNNGTVAATATVEVADTPEDRRTGLMNRTTLPKNHGMLFVYPDTAVRTFWMKHTEVPLDIVFLDEEKRVINVEQADPEPGTPPNELSLYRSDGPAQYVVELRQGYAQRHGVRPGTQVRWRETTG